MKASLDPVGAGSGARRPLRCVLIGDGALLPACGDEWLRAGQLVCGVLTDDEAVARWAEGHGLSVGSSRREALPFLAERDFDYLFSIAHLALLPAEVLARPRRLAINFHDAPLPRRAGLNCPAWAILEGESRHAVTWHVMTETLDEGPVLKTASLEIGAQETTASLNRRCFEAGLESFRKLAAELGSGTVVATPQVGAHRSRHSRHDRPPAAALLDWRRPAAELAALVRALDFGPSEPAALGLPRLVCGGQMVLVRRARVSRLPVSAEPGRVLQTTKDELTVAAGEGCLSLGGLCDLDGRSLSPAEALERLGLERGGRFELPSEGLLRALSELDSRLVRSEVSWLRRFARVRPWVPPALSRPKAEPAETGAAGGWLCRKVSVPEAFLRAHGSSRVALASAVLVHLFRVGEQDRFDVAWLGAEPALAPDEALQAESWLAPHVPLRFLGRPAEGFTETLGRVGTELAQLSSRERPWRDLGLRHPKLAASSAARQSVGLAQGPEDPSPHRLEGLSLCFVSAVDHVRLLHDPRVLPSESALALALELEVLLEGLGRRPEAPVGSHARVSEAQRRQLESWNRTASSWPRRSLVHELIAEQALSRPESVALRHAGRSLTRGELAARSAALAARLRELGVGRDVVVGIALDRSPELPIALLAVLEAGGAYLALDLSHPVARLDFVLEDSGVSLVLTTRELAGRLTFPSGCPCLLLDEESLTSRAEPAVAPAEPVDSSALAYLLYTSGSTGRPKGVLIEHRQVVAFFTAMDAILEREPPGTWLAVTSLAFDISVLELLWTLARGFEVVLAEGRSEAVCAESGRRESCRGGTRAASLPELIDRHAVTHLQCTPSLARLLVSEAAGRRALARLSHLLVGGEALPLDLARGLSRVLTGRLTNMYGPTETTVWSTTWPVEGDCASVAIGRPVANTQVHVLDRHGLQVPVGLVGELFIGGAGVARGYHRRPELTAERFVRDPFSAEPGARLYRTGDLVRLSPEGCLEFLGRCDHQVKIRGHRIELGAVEACLRSHESVREAVVVARDEDGSGPRLIAYCVPAAGAIDIQLLREHARAQLLQAELPSAWVELAALPLNANGKIDRAALPRPVAHEVGSAAALSLEDEVEEGIASVWREVLGHPSIGREDGFFDLGGSSLSAVQAHRLACERLGEGLSLGDLFSFPTVRALAERFRSVNRARVAKVAKGASREAALVSRGRAAAPRIGRIEPLAAKG